MHPTTEAKKELAHSLDEAWMAEYNLGKEENQKYKTTTDLPQHFSRSQINTALQERRGLVRRVYELNKCTASSGV